MVTNIYKTLKDKTVLITGAGSGIGSALAKRMGMLGVKVICVARTLIDINSVANSINENGGYALAIKADATNEKQMKVLHDKIKDKFLGLDYAFLNAGGNIQQQTIEKSDVKEWKEAVDINMLTFFLGVKIATPLMRINGGGRIILTGSAMAHYASPSNSSYGAGKAAARMIANTAALELMEDNITVNEFIPGPVKTKQALKFYSENDINSPFNNPKEWVKEPEDVIDLILMMFAYPGTGPTSQVFSLARR